MPNNSEYHSISIKVINDSNENYETLLGFDHTIAVACASSEYSIDELIDTTRIKEFTLDSDLEYSKVYSAGIQLGFRSNVATAAGVNDEIARLTVVYLNQKLFEVSEALRIESWCSHSGQDSMSASFVSFSRDFPYYWQFQTCFLFDRNLKLTVRLFVN